MVAVCSRLAPCQQVLKLAEGLIFRDVGACWKLRSQLLTSSVACTFSTTSSARQQEERDASQTALSRGASTTLVGGRQVSDEARHLVDVVGRGSPRVRTSVHAHVSCFNNEDELQCSTRIASASSQTSESQDGEQRQKRRETRFPTYADLAAPGMEDARRRPWSKADKAWLVELLQCVFSDAELQAWALNEHINKDLLCKAKAPFARWLAARLPDRAKQSLAARSVGSRRNPALLWPILRGFIRERFQADIRDYQGLVRTADMGKPHLWFPFAREMQRKIIYHAGPTNSGKTFAALQALKSSKNGLYCGPLRLLAVEVFDRVNGDGLPCSLLTGQERVDTPGASHVACTVEMASVSRPVEVAVIDEIQLIADHQRGWAWTKALLGLQAAEVHLCGDISVLGLVQSLCRNMGSPLEVKKYSRMTRLEVEPASLGRSGYGAVQPGDCVVAFSRKDIYQIKAAIERETAHRACVIYGALPPETRRAQAKLFNDPASPFSVLVASDAVGMGLNLNIRRVIFHTMRKFNRASRASELLHPLVVKQIAGRAGRRGTLHEHGLVTTLWDDELAALRAALDVPPDAFAVHAAGLLPEYEQLELYARRKGYPQTCTLPELLNSFAMESKQDASYFLCNQQDMVDLAESIDDIEPLTLQERFMFCKAPVNQKNPAIKAAFLTFAARYATEGLVELCIEVPRKAPTTWPQIQYCEVVHSIASLWLWLSFRFGDAFANRDDVQMVTQQLSELVNEGLKVVSLESSGVNDGQSSWRADIYSMIKTPGIGGDYAHSGGAQTMRRMGSRWDESAFESVGKQSRSARSLQEDRSSHRSDFKLQEESATVW